jgi:hypothetical protein
MEMIEVAWCRNTMDWFLQSKYLQSNTYNITVLQNFVKIRFRKCSGYTLFLKNEL